MRQLRFSALSILLCVSIISALALTALPLNNLAVAATTWYVDDSGGADFTTIQAAVSAAANGDTIMVAAGTYTEAVSTSKTLTFKGARFGVDARYRTGAESIWVVPSPDTPSALHATTATGAIIVDGFKFIGGPACVSLERATAVFNNNIVEVPADCTGPLKIYYLVRISNAGSVTIQHNDISATKAPSSLVVACVDVKISTDPGTVLVDGNRLHNAEECGGFLFEKGTNQGIMTFTNNEVYDNAGDGVSIIGKFDSLTATYNSFHDNAWCGMLIDYTGTQPGTVDIHNCDIYGNGLYGLFNATTSGSLTIDAAENFWGDGTEDYPYSELGAAFGSEISGVTTDPLPGPACAPSVTTNDATNIATTSARLNGNLTSLGTDSSVTVSVVWGMSPGSYPNETTGQVKTSTGTFYSDLSSLTPGTTYYFKAKAVGNGTIYGTEMTFTTATLPSVTTNDATNIATTSARLNGNLSSLGSATSVTVSFVWGTSSGSYPNETPDQIKTSSGTFYSDLSSLTPGVTYYYKTKAVGSGTSYGAEKSFTTTTANPPSVTTNAASNIATTTARLNCNLTSLGSASSVTVSFVWGTSPSSRTFETTTQVLTATGTCYFDLDGLIPGSTYCYEAKAVGDGTSYGEENSFATTCVPPSVTTNAASSIAASSARLNANLTSLGTASSVTVSFVWGTSSGVYPYETTGQLVTAPGTFFFDLDGLTPGTTYYYSARAMGDGASYGAEKAFTTTTATTPPSVTTNDATSVASTSSRLNGNLTSMGSASSVAVSFEWGTSSGSYPHETTVQNRTGTGTFYSDLGSLTPSTTYYYRTKAVGDGTGYGTEKTFTTASGTAPSYPGTGWYEQFTGYLPSPSIGQVYGDNRLCQTFTPSQSHSFDQVSLLLYRVGSRNYTVTVALYATDSNHQPVEPALCSTSTSFLSLPRSITTWRAFVFTTAYELSAGTEYAIVISASGGTSSSRVNLRTYAANVYSGGQMGTSSDAGLTWHMNPDADMAFKEGQGFIYESQPASIPGMRVYGQEQAYQTFTPSRDHYFNIASLSLYKIGRPTYSVTIALHSVDANNQPVQPALCSTSFLASALTAKATWRTYVFPAGYPVSAGTCYALVISASGSNGYVIVSTNTTGGYDGGECGSSPDGGTTWQALAGPDLAFREGDYAWYTASGSSNSSAYVYGQNRLCQTFTPSVSHYFDYVSLSMYTIGTPTYTVTVSLHNVDEDHQPTGSALCSTTFAASSLTTPKPTWKTYPWYEFRFPTGYQLSQDTEYVLVVSGNGGDAANSVVVRYYSGNRYLRGQRGSSADGGASWQMLTNQDMAFIEGGSHAAAQAGSGWYDQFTGYAPSPSNTYVYDQNHSCQTFTASESYYFDSVSLWLQRTGSLNYTVTIALYATDGNHQPTGSALCSTSFAKSTLPLWATTWRTYAFTTGYQLSAGTEYALVISANGGNLSNRVNVRTYAANGYSGGRLGTSSDAGQTWQMDAGGDMAFKAGQGNWRESQFSATPGVFVYDQSQVCQTFTPSRDHYFNLVSLYLYRWGNPTYTVTVSLHSVDANDEPVQPALCSTTFAASSLPRTAAWRTYLFAAGYEVSAGTQYALVISGSGSNGYVVAGSNTAGGHSGGACSLSADGGASWQALSGPDLAFKEGDYPWYTVFGSSNAFATLHGQNQLCQTFTPSKSHYFDYLSLCLYKVGTPLYNVTISVYNVDENHQPTGSALCSTTFAASSLTLPKPSYRAYPWYEFRFPTGCQLYQGTEYALVLSASGGDAANTVTVRISNKNSYVGGQRGTSADGGATWQMLATQDMTFIEGGTA
ncbi:MAG: right-handed parallel beta-helix repeat-containing protein [Dehalococcoidia bacterium]|nr:right-handed parallel beta-helix repeat-containing protein [Dehalococcoidia bacterium]